MTKPDVIAGRSVATAQSYNAWVPPTGGVTDGLYG
jgi:hypothetical protein